MSSTTAPEANPPPTLTLRKVKSRKDALNKAINDHNTHDPALAPPLPWTGSYVSSSLEKEIQRVGG